MQNAKELPTRIFRQIYVCKSATNIVILLKASASLLFCFLCSKGTPNSAFLIPMGFLPYYALWPVAQPITSKTKTSRVSVAGTFPPMAICYRFISFDFWVIPSVASVQSVVETKVINYVYETQLINHVEMNYILKKACENLCDSA